MSRNISWTMTLARALANFSGVRMVDALSRILGGDKFQLFALLKKRRDLPSVNSSVEGVPSPSWRGGGNVCTTSWSQKLAGMIGQSVSPGSRFMTELPRESAVDNGTHRYLRLVTKWPPADRAIYGLTRSEESRNSWKNGTMSIAPYSTSCRQMFPDERFENKHCPIVNE